MIEWGAWKFDEISAVVVEPSNVVLTWCEGRVFAEFIRLKGGPVTQEALILASGTNGRVGLYALVASITKKLRAAKLPVPASRFKFGYYLPEIPKDFVDPKVAKVVALLIDQFEATGPHARSVAKMVAEVYQ